jgi:hypothetical protein
VNEFQMTYNAEDMTRACVICVHVRPGGYVSVSPVDDLCMEFARMVYRVVRVADYHEQRRAERGGKPS